MTTWTYLNQLRNIDRRIQDKLRESCEWRDIAQGKRAQLTDMKVQKSPKQDVMADAVARAVDYEREASQLAVHMTELKHTIITQIDAIDDEQAYNVLKEHFVQQIGIGTMADRYFLTYNGMKRRIHSAVDTFSKMYGEKW